MPLYFGYGSNLNYEDRRAWCEKQGCDDFVKKAVEHAYLPDHEWVFHYVSKSRGGGALDIRPRLGQLVPGMLFEIAPGAWDWLDKKEGARTAYRRKEVVVLTPDGGEHHALTYEVVPERREDGFITPAPGYAEIVEQGLKHWGYETELFSAIAQNREAPILCRDLFVYGTLMSGELADWRIGPSLANARLWTLPGQLWHLGRYPGMMLAQDKNDKVQGERVRVGADEWAPLIKALDDYEEFLGYEAEESEYLRCIYESGEDNCDLVWAYRLRSSEPKGRRIESGNWRLGKDQT